MLLFLLLTMIWATFGIGWLLSRKKNWATFRAGWLLLGKEIWQHCSSGNGQDWKRTRKLC